MTETKSTPAISIEQAEHSAKILDGFVADYIRDLNGRSQSMTAQAVQLIASNAATQLLAFIKAPKE